MLFSWKNTEQLYWTGGSGNKLICRHVVELLFLFNNFLGMLKFLDLDSGFFSDLSKNPKLKNPRPSKLDIIPNPRPALQKNIDKNKIRNKQIQ